MDNPNPIYYKDLVTPDNSITQLIEQLTNLIAKYNEAKQTIQGAAAEMAKGMQGVSGATEEQRQKIDLVTKETDKLAAQYSKVTSEEQAQQRVLLTLKQAQKEKNDIDKLAVRLATSQKGSYNQLSAQYRLNKIRLNEMSEAERHGTQAGRDLETETRKIYERMSELQKATGKYTLEVGHYENAMRALPAPLRTFTQGVSQMSAQMKNIGQSDLPLAAKAMQGLGTVAFGTIGIILQMVKYLTTGVAKLREFEQANANLSTILGVTRDEMKALTDSALSLGRTTEYTASQVTQLQTELAKLGFGQGSIIAMQKSVLQFATAVGAGLGEAAEVAGSTLRAFNLTSKDTDDVLATLAVATNKSALSFEKIRTSIGTVFPVANAYGLTVKDTTALLGALANAGFDASTAATATRNILLNLANANGKLAKSLGGSVGTFDEIIDGLIQLRKSGIDVAGALELTDKRSVAAFSAFLSGAESARELRQSLEDVSGELDRIQSERLNTVEGSTKLLQSAWEGLTLAFQNSNGAIKDTIDWLTRLITKTQQLLFPEQTFVSNAADQYTKDFQAYYAKNGAEAAKAFINSFLSTREEQAQQAEREAKTGGFLNRVLGIGQQQVAAKATTQSLAGMRQAADVVLMQIENDANEAAARAARQAEQDAQAAAEKADQLTKEQQKAAEKAKRQRIADRKAVVESINLEIATTTAGTDKMLELRLAKVEAERQLELETNRQKVTTEKQDEAAINAKYDKQILDTKQAFANEVSKIRMQGYQTELANIQLEIAVTREGTDEMLALRVAAINKQRQIEIEQNAQKDEKLRQDEAKINAKYDAQVLKQTADFYTKRAQTAFEIQQEADAAEFSLLNRNERQKTQFKLAQEKARLENILALNETAATKMTAEEIAAIKNTIKAIEKESARTPYNNIYELLGIGLDSDQQDALNTALSSVKDSVESIIDSWKQAADAAVEAANKQVEAAQTALDAEIEARNNGYANNVLQAQKELELQRKTQAQALKEQEKAQKAQLLIDTITQASSLITASANIWKALSPITPAGPALAVAALATMWASFAAAKVKAAQVTKYGDGTVELLQGGSHASGHDIDMGVTRDGKRRRAEGGEYFAIINKRNSRRFGSIIPDVINSLNDGTFADKYQKANAAMAGYAINFAGTGTDVSRLEKDVRAIKEQGNETRYIDANGNLVIRYKNLTRKIRS